MIKPSVETVYKLAHEYGGGIHGDDPNGVVDISWREGFIWDAVGFARDAIGRGWQVDLTVVLQVHAAPRRG